jgi:hypothetical protein
VGPSKHALELLRSKIERQGEVVSRVRTRYNAAKQVRLVTDGAACPSGPSTAHHPANALMESMLIGHGRSWEGLG